MAKVSFLGLGVMGYPMAGHLLKKGGHEVTVYNRSPAKAEERNFRHRLVSKEFFEFYRRRFDSGLSTDHNTCAFIQYPVSAQAQPAVDVDSL